MEPSGDKLRLKIKITFTLTVCCSSERVSALGQFEATQLSLISNTKPLLLLLQMAGDVHLNSGSASKYPCLVCTRNVISRGVSYQCNICSGWVHAKCSGLLNAAQYRRSKDWTCDPCSTSTTQQSPPPAPAPSVEEISDDSTFTVLQLNANGLGNKLTELGVVLERDKVKVAVIQESKLSSKSLYPCIRKYTTVC